MALKSWLFLLGALAFSASLRADTLTTASFKISIERHCEEGDVSCDRVSYLGESRKSGAKLALRGKTVHTRCADGMTPCRFLGYQFKSGRTTYLVLEEGRLQVRRGDKLLVDEAGEWSY